MKLDRVHNIACIASAVFICLPFLMDSLIADIPRWGWQVMTVFIANFNHITWFFNTFFI